MERPRRLWGLENIGQSWIRVYLQSQHLCCTLGLRGASRDGYPIVDAFGTVPPTMWKIAIRSGWMVFRTSARMVLSSPAFHPFTMRVLHRRGKTAFSYSSG